MTLSGFELAQADIPTVVVTGTPWTTQTGGQYTVHGAYDPGVGGWDQANYDPNYASMYQNSMSSINNAYRLYQGFTVARDVFWLFTSDKGTLGQRLGYVVADRATQYYDRNYKPLVDVKIAQIEARAKAKAAQMGNAAANPMLGNCPTGTYPYGQNPQGVTTIVYGGQIQGAATAGQSIPNPTGSVYQGMSPGGAIVGTGTYGSRQ
ncbi:MAG: hypothetical protein R3A11_07880 [Bdellovibrionota bacterium]